MVRSTIANDVVRARVNSEVKHEAAAILASIGLTPSDAYRMLLARIVEERALPFEPLVPNETTIAAIREARSADLPRFASVEDLMSDLNADD
ncbi:MAG: type II toxin-antitoxin system RelB/DinJ family antitoxin [Actinobacteria bacterium]|nr:type II toxin-antitoxin system RelB/DinJ family antitoxin [Actinomycetota bacterium]